MIVKLSLLAASMVLFAGVGYAQEQDPVHIEPRVPEKAPTKSKRRVVAPTSTNSSDGADDKAGPITPGQSSSKDTKIDLSPPKNEAKAYPDSGEDDVTETRPFDPHKAQKDIEVGDYYAKRGNLKAALARYESALTFQDNNGEAIWKAALTAEKIGNRDAAAKHYRDYVAILPRGEHRAHAEKALQRLHASL